MKRIFIIFTLLMLSLGANAQTLTPLEKAVFDRIAFKRRQVGEYEVISKWIIPIRYKIYGDTSASIKKEIDSTFSEIKRLTKLDIQKTTDDDEANFVVLMQKGRGFYEAPNLSKDIGVHLSKYGGALYKTNSKHEIYRVENIILLVNYKSKSDVRAAIKRSIVKSLGFFKDTDIVPNSLFYNSFNGKMKIDTQDAHIIETLYHQQIKAGMTKDETDKILTVN